MAFDFGKYDKQHLRNIAQMAKEVEALFDQLNQKAVQVVINAGINADSADFDFFFGDFPAVNKQMGDALQEFHNSMQGMIERGEEQAWLLSNEKNAAMLASLQKRAGFSDEWLERLQKPNVDALQAFQTRKENGMNLSQRVWNLTQQHKESLELALEVGLADGTDARQLSRVVRKYLNEPNKLFRRVRDKKTGQLRLSKAAAAYHPSRGVYRSSYKNALRMTGTEINMAYRTADSDKWQQLDMVLGIEVHVSPTNHTLNGVPFFDICDELAGTYPKEFKFVGWHPNCRCMAVPKLPSRKELSRYKKAIWQGKEDNFNFRGNVTEMPENFTGWVAANTDKILAAKNTPYFIRDNYTGGDISKGYRWLTKAEKKVQPLTTLEKAAQRHAVRTEEEIAAIRRRAANRQKLIAEGFDEDFANLRRYAKEWGVDISKVENLFNNENFANIHLINKFIVPMNEYSNIVYDRIAKWSDFKLSLRPISRNAANLGAKGRALIKRMDIKNFEALKATFTDDQLKALRDKFSKELEAIKAHRGEVKKLWDKRVADNLSKNKVGIYTTSKTDKEAAEQLATKKILSPVEWANSLTEKEAEIIINKIHNYDYASVLRIRGVSVKTALANLVGSVEKEIAPHLNKVMKFASSNGFKNLHAGVAKRAEQFITEYYEMMVKNDYRGMVNAASGASNLVELIKRGADFNKTSMMMPFELLPNGKWFEADITIDKSFFDKFKSFVPVEVRKDNEAYYSPSKRMVHLGTIDSRHESLKYRQQLIYHEFGHSQGDAPAFGIDASKGVSKLMKEWRDKYRYSKSIEMTYEAKSKKYKALSDAELLFKTGKERAELVTNWCAFSDVFGALSKDEDVQFRGGHFDGYWRHRGMPEAEFVAHCFEFKFIGNPVAEKYEPELYKAMVKLIDDLFK